MLLLLTLVVSSLAQTPCPNGGVYQSLFDKCIYLSTDLLQYGDAEAACQHKGGHLISVTSAFQNSYLSGMLPSSSTDVWIGLFRNSSSANWQWLDGTPVGYKATFDQSCTYFYNLYGSVSDYVWRCGEYTTKKQYFCELSKTLYVPPTCPNGGDWNDVMQTCILPGTNYLYHDDAAAYCATFGGTLISIHSAEQNFYLMNYAYANGYSINGGIWIGASRAWFGGNWTWDDGTPFDYNNAPGLMEYPGENTYYANYMRMGIPIGDWEVMDNSGGFGGFGFLCSLPTQKYYPALTTTPSTVNPLCPNGGDYDDVFKGCLFAMAWEEQEFADVSHWTEAEHSCNGYGGHLVSIHSDEQNQRFTLFASMNNLGLGNSLWLGASRSNEQANFVWNDGTPFNYSNVDSSTGNCSVSGYDNNILGVYIPNGTWSCLSDSEKHNWACLLPTVLTPTPASPRTTADPRCPSFGTYDNVFDACLYASPVQQLYFDAEDDCNTKGGHLVSIHSPEQNQRVINLAMMTNLQLGDEVFIGLIRDNSTAPWHWTDGSLADYMGNVVETGCSAGATQTTLQMTVQGDWSCAHHNYENYICKLKKA